LPIAIFNKEDAFKIWIAQIFSQAMHHISIPG
jgi:hypothetical protein